MPIYSVETLPAERFPLVQFVSAPEVGATVRFDFNSAGVWADEDVWPAHEGFSLGVPVFEGDPDGIGVEYGLRELAFNFVVKGSDTAATQAMSALARELLRPTNWLLFYKSAEAAPVWFKTYRTQPGDMDFEHVYTDRHDQWYGIGVTLAADPFAYGERVELPSVTISNDPAVRRNLVPNPSFEVGTTGWFADNATAVRTSTVWHGGSHSLQLTASTAGAVGTNTHSGTSGIPVTGGETYSAAARVRSATVVRPASVALDWYDAAGVALTTDTGPSVDTSTTGWLPASVTAAAPVSAAFARIRVRIPGPVAAGEVHYVDSVIFEESPTPLPFGYGDSDGWTWDGTPHASTSRSVNPMSYTLPEIKGDAPAPLTLSTLPDAETRARAILGVAQVPDSWAGPYVWQSSAFTASTDTSATETTDASFSGGSYRSISFATNANLLPRLSGEAPTKPPRGRYRLLARVARSDTSSTFTLQGGIVQRGSVDSAIVGDVVTLSGTSTAATWATLVDLGSFQLPTNGGVSRLPTLTGDYMSVDLEFRAGRTSGTGSLRVDYFLLIPEVVDGEPATNLWVDNGDIGWWGYPWDSLVIDGDVEATAWTYQGIEAFLTAPVLSGGFPVVTPGATNVLHLAMHVDPTAVTDAGLGGTLNNADAITATTDLEISYHPRYLYLAAV